MLLDRLRLDTCPATILAGEPARWGSLPALPGIVDTSYVVAIRTTNDREGSDHRGVRR